MDIMADMAEADQAEPTETMTWCDDEKEAAQKIELCAPGGNRPDGGRQVQGQGVQLCRKSGLWDDGSFRRTQVRSSTALARRVRQLHDRAWREEGHHEARICEPDRSHGQDF